MPGLVIIMIYPEQISFFTGVLVTYLLGAVVGDQHWRWLLVSGALIAIVQVLCNSAAKCLG